MELQDLLIDRFVEHREATAAGQEERVKIVEVEIDGLLAEKAQIEKWAGVGSAYTPNRGDRLPHHTLYAPRYPQSAPDRNRISELRTKRPPLDRRTACDRRR